MSSDPSQWLTGGDTVHFSSINDIESCRRMFEEASSRLFKPNQTGEFEVLYARLDNSMSITQSFRGRFVGRLSSYVLMARIRFGRIEAGTIRSDR
jgi:hypothetical protein